MIRDNIMNREIGTEFLAKEFQKHSPNLSNSQALTCAKSKSVQMLLRMIAEEEGFLDRLFASEEQKKTGRSIRNSIASAKRENEVATIASRITAITIGGEYRKRRT